MADARVKVVIFSGGRGTASITNALLRHAQLEVTVLLNAYDDGLSTGRLRKLVPGMLGPSDVRKCYTRLIPDADRSDRALRDLLEHRLPKSATREEGEGYVRALCHVLDREPFPALPMLEALRLDQARAVAQAMRAFAAHLEGKELDFGDCCVGNMVFAGLFLRNDRSFNAAVDAFGALVQSRARVLNVTSGEALTLMGLKTDGTVLFDEASIVAPQSKVPLRDIYLVRAPLPAEAALRLSRLDPGKHELLSELHVFPAINPACREVLRDADIIIYGPGTQHSSLFPSYMTEEVGELVAGNHRAEKIFIANIAPDTESQSETSASLAAKLVYYMRRKGAV